MSATKDSKEKGKKARKGRDGDTNPSELGEPIDALSDVEVKMRLEAMDTFGKWYVAKVLEVDEDSGDILVHFDRWSSRYDEYIPIDAGRLRRLTPSRLKELQKEKDPMYVVGDRVQAKWEDGKMYFGKVLQVNEDSVDVLFDDGVEYTAPLRSVRKRRPEKSIDHTPDNMQGSVENLVAVEARRTRAEKRSRNDDSTSQSSVPSSPPSSPPAPPWSKRPCRRIESDSTETESDFDDPQHPHIGECPLKPRDTSPDGEQPVKLGRARKLNAREPYKLRKAAKGKPLKDDEVKMSSESMDTGESGIGALLTPPSGGTPTAKPSVKTPPSPPPPPPDEESPKQIPNPTPPETPQTDSQSENGILKRMLSQESSPAAKKSQSSEDSTHSPSTSRKKPPVSSRTRAQTKFENITKKVDKKDKKLTAKAAPKGLVIVWDHNEFKCKVTGCNKSFRKESLLQSHIKHYHTKEIKTPKTPNKQRGPSGAFKKSMSPKSPQPQSSPLSPSRLALSPRSPKTPCSPRTQPSHSEAVKSPSSRKPKSILSPQPRRNPSRSKTAAEIENREKSPTESFFEIMEKQRKSGEMMQLLELATKEQKTTAAASHKPLTIRAPMRPADKGSTSGHHSTPSKGPPSTNKPPSSGLKKLRQTTLNVKSAAIKSVAGPPQKGQAVEIQTVSHDSVQPHPSLATKTAAELGLTSPSTSNSKSVHEVQLNNSDSMEDMDTSNEFEGGEMFASSANEGNEEDVVHCLCGSIEDEGFMIQCEQCLCWQHGDCVGLTEETLPKKYICYICDNPPGLRKRYQYQFDHDWFNEGTLPSLSGGPKFPNANCMKKTHELAGELYKLRKMMHSSKVKLQAASKVNHPYLKQWAKECAHQSRDDIMSYIMQSLLPVSYPQRSSSSSKEERSEMTTAEVKEENNSKEKEDGAAAVEASTDDPCGVTEGASAFSSQNGSLQDRAVTDNAISPPIDVSSLHLDPLPHSPPSPHTPPSYSNTAANIDDPPDPKSLQLAPLPPLTSEDPPSSRSDSPNRTYVASKEDKPRDCEGASSKAAASTSLEVFNDEFGIQEMSVFATTTGQQQQSVSSMELTGRKTEPNPGRLISSSRSAFRPVVVVKSREASSIPASIARLTTSSASERSSEYATTSMRDNNSNSADSAVSAAEPKRKVGSDSVVMQTLSRLSSVSKTTSGMDSVTLGEFSEAFVKGDTTNWFQRMLLLDHIEAVQEKIKTWMEMIDKQLDAMPEEGEGEGEEGAETDDMESLLKTVQSSIEQLGKLQQASVAS